MEKFALDERTMAILQQYLKPMGIGAGVGALGMGAAELARDKDPNNPEDDDGLMKSMLLGAGLGGAGGLTYQSGKNLMKPDADSPEDLQQHGMPKVPTDPLLNLTRHGPREGIAAGAGYAAHKGVGAMSSNKDISKLEPSPITWGGIKNDPTGKSDPYLATAMKQKGDQLKTQNPGLSKKPQEFQKALDSHAKQLGDTFNAEAKQVMQHANPNGSMSRDALQQLASSQTTKPTLNPGKNWNPAKGKLDPANETLVRARQTLGAAGGHMTPLQKLTAAVWNPVANAAGNIPGIKDYAYGQKDLPGMEKARGLVDGLKNSPSSWKQDLGKLVDIVPDAPGRPTRELNPTYIQPKEMHQQLPSWAVGDTGPRKGLAAPPMNRLAYKPKSTVMEGLMNGKPSAMYGRGRGMVGPAVGLGTYLGLGGIHDNGVENVIQEAAKSGPDAAAEIERLTSQFANKQQQRGKTAIPGMQ